MIQGAISEGELVAVPLDSPKLGFDAGAGVMRDQSGDPLQPLSLHKTAAVEWMESRDRQRVCVADVMQVSRCH